MKRKSNKNAHQKNDMELDIHAVILKIYLIPLAKIFLFLWLIISGNVFAGCTIYMLFGLYELYRYSRMEDSNINNWFVAIVGCVLLWPALDIFSFFPPKRY